MTTKGKTKIPLDAFCCFCNEQLMLSDPIEMIDGDRWAHPTCASEVEKGNGVQLSLWTREELNRHGLN